MGKRLNFCLGVGQVIVEVMPIPVFAQRAPTSTDTDYPLGQNWLDESQNPSVMYFHIGSGSWELNNVPISTDGTFSSPSDTVVPSTLATKTYVDAVASFGAPIASTGTQGIGFVASNAQAVARQANTAGVSAYFVTPSNLDAVLASPSAIGSTSASTGAFTTLTASGAFSLTGDQVQVAEGGTGAATFTDHGILLGSGTSAVSVTAVGTNNQLLIGQTAADPIWSDNIDVPGTLDVTGASTLDSTLDVAGAATFSSTATVGNIELDTNTISTTNVNGNLNLTPNGSGVVAASELTLTTDLAVAHGGTGASTLTDHGVLIGSGTSAITPLTVGTNGQVLLGSSAADPVFATLASADGTITYTTGAGTLDLAVTPATETQVGGLEIATDVEAVAVAATDKIIVPSNLAAVFAAPPAIGSTTPAAAEFTTVTIADINADYTDHGVLLGQGTDTNLVATAAGTNGQVLVGSTGADPAFATISSANSSIASILGAGTLSLDVDPSYLQVDTVTIATGDVLTLATTPVELVAAPAAGSFIQFVGAAFILDYNSIAYTESGDNLGIKYTDAAGVQVSSTIEMTGFIDQSADMMTSAIPAADAIVAASAANAKALVLDNLGSNFAAGNSPLIVKIAYRVIASGL